jgi:hypothetical protein
MIKIPKPLQNRETRFILLCKNSKLPIKEETGWSVNGVVNENLVYKFDDPILLEHLKNGGNYGIATGYGGLIVVDPDTDELDNTMKNNFATFTVKTPRRQKQQNYFYCPEIQNKIVFAVKGNHQGELQAKGQYVVAPGSFIKWKDDPKENIKAGSGTYEVADDIEIATISREDLLKVLEKYKPREETLNILPKELSESAKVLQSLTSNYPIIWIENLWNDGVLDGRRRILNLILIPYTKEYLGWDEEKSVTWIMEYIGRCNLKNPTDIDEDYISRNWKRNRINHLSLENVTKHIPELGEFVKEENKRIENKEETKIIKLLEEKETEIKNFSDVLLYPTRHLANYDELDKLIGLFGKEYRIIKKSVWYYINSLPVRATNIMAGRVETDGRIQLAIPMPSGSGKRNLIDPIISIAKSLELVYSRPASFHPEQLVGKTVIKKPKKGQSELQYLQIPGHFSSDIIIINEGIELLKSEEPNYKEARKYFNIALDPYPKNEVAKKMVEVPKEYELKYCPICNTLLLYQPYNVDEEIILSGLLRRFIIPYVPLLNRNTETEFSQRLYSDNVELKNYLEKITEDLKSKNGKDFTKIKIPESSKKKMEYYHSLLESQGKLHSAKGKNYTKLIKHTLGDQLLKLSLIQAVSRNKDTIEPDDVEFAYVDLAEIWQATLDYVSKKVYGNFDYGESWGGATQKNIECLKWLKEVNATSLEKSQVSIEDYINKVAEIFEFGAETARKKYYKHLHNGWIKSKQTGKNESKVWLIYAPEDEGVQGGKGVHSLLEIEKEYQNLVKKILNINIMKLNLCSRDTTIPPLPSLPPSKQKTIATSETIEDKILSILPLDVEFSFATWERIWMEMNPKDQTGAHNLFGQVEKKAEKEGRIFYPREGIVIRRRFIKSNHLEA